MFFYLMKEANKDVSETTLLLNLEMHALIYIYSRNSDNSKQSDATWFSLTIKKLLARSVGHPV
jgi:hypothetical protein